MPKRKIEYILLISIAFITALSAAGTVTRSKDTNGDGKPDIRAFFGPGGDTVREDIDLNFDGIFELHKVYVDSALVMIQKDKDGNGKVDTWEFYKNEKLNEIEVDTNGDGNPDKTIFSKKKAYSKPTKKKHNVFVKTNDYYKNLIRKITNIAPTTFYKISQWVFKMEGEESVKIPSEPDRRFNKMVMVVLEKEGALKKIGISKNNIVEIGFLFRNGKLVKRISDLNRDKKPDDFTYYENGVIKREEIDVNHDTRINSWREFIDGKISSEKYDSNFDGFVDQWKYFQGGNIVKSEYDTNYDTKADKFFHYLNKHLDRMEQDHNHDVTIDHRVQYNDFGHKLKATRDTNFDGIVDRWEYYKKNKLSRILLDTDMDGEPDEEVIKKKKKNK